MRNRTLLIVGVVCLVIGLMPGIMDVHLAHAGGALIVLAAIRFLASLAVGWLIATVIAGLLGVVQYFFVAALEPGATQFQRWMFLSWSEAVAICGGALLLIAAFVPLRDWKRRRDEAARQAAMREDEWQWRS